MTRQKRAVLRPRSALGAGGWELISGTASLLIRRRVMLLLGSGDEVSDGSRCRDAP